MRSSRGDDRRRHVRRLRLAYASFRSDTQRGEGHVLNVSPDGLFMRVDEPPPVDEIVRVTIEAPSGGIAVDGRVQWVAPLHMTPRPGFGVQILEAPETYTDFVYATRITDHGYGVMRHPGLHAAKRASTD